MLTLTAFQRAATAVPRNALRTMATEAPKQPDSLSSAISLIRSQPSRYVVASVVGRKYLLAPKDLLTVPRLNDLKVGDTIALTDIHEIGSRDYTIRGDPLIPKNALDVKATVVEHTKGNMEFIFKKKRRKGYEKTIQHKQTYTRLRIGEFGVVEGDKVVPL